jgi:hypothetical protein
VAGKGSDLLSASSDSPDDLLILSDFATKCSLNAPLYTAEEHFYTVKKCSELLSEEF